MGSSESVSVHYVFNWWLFPSGLLSFGPNVERVQLGIPAINHPTSPLQTSGTSCAFKLDVFKIFALLLAKESFTKISSILPETT